MLNKFFRGEAVNTSVYLRNRYPTKILGEKPPYEVCFKRKPNLQHLRTFGSFAVALNKSDKSGGKFETKGETYIIVDYPQVAKAYRLHNKNIHSIIERRYVIFEDNGLKNADPYESTPKAAEDYLTIVVDNSNQRNSKNSIDIIIVNPNPLI